VGSFRHCLLNDVTHCFDFVESDLYVTNVFELRGGEKSVRMLSGRAGARRHEPKIGSVLCEQRILNYGACLACNVLKVWNGGYALCDNEFTLKVRARRYSITCDHIFRNAISVVDGSGTNMYVVSPIARYYGLSRAVLDNVMPSGS
jgi:hypothetical protein